MARNGPLVTLLAGGALGVGLLLASTAATPEQPELGEEPVAGVTDSPTADPSEPEAEPTDEQGDELGEPEATDTPDEDVGEQEPADSTEPAQPPAEASEPVTYVGYVDSGEASVAVIVDGAGEAIAYVCDGVGSEAWLSGPATDGQVELSGERGSLSATYDGFVVEGQTTVDGNSWTFSIALVEPPDGLYRFADTISGGAEVVGGWIVLPDGDQVGLVTVDGETAPAEMLDVETGQVTIDGDIVTAERQG
jgi:hypothetical protein